MTIEVIPCGVSNERRFKAVLFDMGGVLLQYKDPTSYGRLMKRAKEDKALAKDCHDFDVGTKSVEEIWDIVNDVFPGLPRQNLENCRVEDYAYLDLHMQQLIQKLRNAGIKVGLVTNNGFWSKLKNRTLVLSDLSKFDVVLESCRLGIKKPDPQIFELAAKRLGLSPNECIFVDDTEGHCNAARTTGMAAVHVDGCRALPAVEKIEELLGFNVPKLNGFVPSSRVNINGYNKNVTHLNLEPRYGAKISTYVWQSTYV
ncbi:haloacid dehalogenase-like hydrolase domain-containing protein [Ditylenchus destructor]|uniref:Haloacid dehalogenase-like hydrolase domain-containing protein n=1 Tax=Ditylenchus destructor TaxID=166010 RepID=A0AAD4MK36_9BILA|nr:haloacid dehalogenase-like hydrolase domain-containing protein [Ditylenchus destructor]